MAKNNTKQAAQTLPSPDEAYQQLFTSIHQRVFFHKLASVRPEYMPKTPQQAEFLLKMAGDLRMVDDGSLLKSAEEANDPFAAASMALEQQLATLPGMQTAGFREEQAAIKTAAAQWADVPEIYNAVLALKADEAENIATQLKQQR
jgi:hypothetical protein